MGKKCVSCHKNDGVYEYGLTGEYFICEKCAPDYFTCPKCGRLFDMEDRVNGDAGSGFCTECTIKYGL